MDAYFHNELIHALMTGDITKLLGYGLIFFFLWNEMRGLKKELSKLNNTIGKSFAEGEKKFEEIEHRLTMLEEHKGV